MRQLVGDGKLRRLQGRPRAAAAALLALYATLWALLTRIEMRPVAVLAVGGTRRVTRASSLRPAMRRL